MPARGCRIFDRFTRSLIIRTERRGVFVFLGRKKPAATITFTETEHCGVICREQPYFRDGTRRRDAAKHKNHAPLFRKDDYFAHNHQNKVSVFRCMASLRSGKLVSRAATVCLLDARDVGCMGWKYCPIGPSAVQVTTMLFLPAKFCIHQYFPAINPSYHKC